MQQLDVPCATYHYMQLTAAEVEAMGEHYKEFTYRLLATEACTTPLQLSTACIERNTLGFQDLAQIQVFNEVYLLQSNMASLRLIFHDLDGLTHVCTPATGGKLRVLSVEERREGSAPPAMPSTAMRPPSDGDGDVYFAASAYTMVHDYAETHSGRCFHVGISFLPVGPLFLPLWLSPHRMRRMLVEWSGPRLDAARRESLLVVRWLRGHYSVRHVLSRSPEKNETLIVTAAESAAHAGHISGTGSGR